MTRQRSNKLSRTLFRGAKNTIAVGIDGVELHGALGYLINQLIDLTPMYELTNMADQLKINVGPCLKFWMV